MKHVVAILIVLSGILAAQDKPQTAQDQRLLALATTDLGSFAREVSKTATSELEQAQQIVKWLAEHFDWKATDYQQRTVQQIIERGGGNCAELARVAVAALKEMKIKMRQIREINIHQWTPERGVTAHKMVEEKGKRFSVFGRHHNDHVWIEIYDSKAEEWYPADPSIGIVGTEEWLKARIGFGKRFTLDPSSEDMIAPFVVLAAAGDGKFINRTQHYLVDGFDNLYQHKLSALPAWKNWVRLLDELDDKAEGAFKGEVNLHDYEDQIDTLAQAYDDLRSEYLAKK